MAGRFDRWRRLRGDKDRPDLVKEGEKMLGYLAEQRRISGVKSQVIHRRMPDGSVVRAQFVGDQPMIEITTAQAGGQLEEVIHLFVSSSDGLHIFDLGSKKEVQLITGLGDYNVHAVTGTGKIAYLSNDNSTGQLIVVRADISALDAFGFIYTVKTPDSPSSNPPIDGYATAADAGLISVSPDGKLALVHFGGSMTTTGIIREGVGGILLIDTETLEPVRPPIRMTFKPAPVAWAPDSSKFYIACSQPDDVGDSPTNSRLQALTESEQDYVAAFSSDGDLISSTPVAAWTVPPDSGFSRLTRAMAADAERVFLSIIPDPADPQPPRLVVLDADSLAVKSSLALDTIDPDDAPTVICLSRSGSTITLSYADRVAEVSIDSGDSMEVEFFSTHEFFITYAPTRADAVEVLQLGPESSIGAKPDNRRFHYAQDTGVRIVRGYNDMELDSGGSPKPSYTLDLDEAAPGHSFKTDFCLAVVGTRPLSKSK
ncbi:MAG TPA: hypothetical protein VIQ76_15965 [Propionibacteriaceae bacterium]